MVYWRDSRASIRFREAADTEAEILAAFETVVPEGQTQIGDGAVHPARAADDVVLAGGGANKEPGDG